MEPIRVFKSRTVVLAVDNVDTDQIIPARFLKVTSKAGLGRNLFADWRYEKDDSPKAEFVLNRPESAGAAILVAGDNFGCGSSREHAPWALTDHGFRAVVSTTIADIFRNNALKNGLLPVIVDPQTHKMLFDMVEELPRAEVTIDLAAQTVRLPTGHAVDFPIDPFSKNCLLRGVDELGYILGFGRQIEEYEGKQVNR
jgi:3-isopropylmalate/(R)-2-methylmalate dehydratase small subunit